MELTITPLKPSQIERSPHNPRIFREKDPELASLAASIKAKGVLEPILVRPIQGVNGIEFQLIAGERRWRASQLAELATVPAIIRADVSEQEAIELTVTENLQREDLHPLEEANGVATLLANGDDYRLIADRLGKSLGWVARRARLTKLSKKWRARVANPADVVSGWSGAHLELLARLEPEAQDHLLTDAGPWWAQESDEIVHLDLLKRGVAEYTRELRLAPWALEDATLYPKAGACSTCPKRSSCTPGLFDDDLEGKKAPGDHCLDATCWREKLDLQVGRQIDKLKQEHGKVIAIGGHHGGQSGELKSVKSRNLSILPEWQFEKVKAGAAGATPAVVVRGDKVGKVEWVKATSRVALDARRKSHAVTAFQTALRDGKIAAPPGKMICRLVALFGTSHRLDNANNGWAGEKIDKRLGLRDGDGTPWRAMGKLAKEAEILEVLWLSLCETLAGRLTHYDTTGAATRWDEEVLALGKYLTVDVTPYLAAATREIPEPKSWAKETAAAKEKPPTKTKKSRKAA